MATTPSAGASRIQAQRDRRPRPDVVDVGVGGLSGSGSAIRPRGRRRRGCWRSSPRCSAAAARSGTLPCWRTARRRCACWCGRAGRCRRRWCRGSRAHRSMRPARRATGHGTRRRIRPTARRADRCPPLSSSRLPIDPCACLVPSGTVLHIPAVHRSTRTQLPKDMAGSDSSHDERSDRRTESPFDPRASMPPAVRLPKPVQGVMLSGFRRWFQRNAMKRYGPIFAINVPFFGRSVVVSDPALARQVFLASTDDLINVQPNLSRIFGPGFGIRAGRQGTPRPPQAVGSAVPRPEHQELRKDHRRGDAARDGDVARGHSNSPPSSR